MATVKDLKICAKGLGLKGYSTLTKSELEEMIGKAGVPAQAPVAKKDEAPMAKEPAKEPTVVPEIKEKRVRAKSTWNAFLSDYRTTNKCSLKDAMAAKDAYAEFKTKNAQKSE